MRQGKMTDEEIKFEAIRQRVMTGNDGSVPDPMITRAPGFPLLSEIDSRSGTENKTAIENGIKVSDELNRLMLGWVNGSQEDPDRWIGVTVKLAPAELFLMFWLYNQQKLWSTRQLDLTPEKTPIPVPQEKMNDFASNYLRAMIVDMFFSQTAKLSEGTHPLTRQD